MQITVSDKLIRRAAARYVENAIYRNYTKKELIFVGVPVKAALVDELMIDEKFMNRIERDLNKIIDRYDVDDIVNEININRVDALNNYLIPLRILRG